MRSLAPFDEQADVSTKADHYWMVTFSIAGNLSVGSGINHRQGFPFDMEMVSWAAYLGTAPATQSVIFELNKNGSAQTTLSVTAGQTFADASVSVSFLGGQYATIDINQVGTGTVGADATITLLMKYA